MNFWKAILAYDGTDFNGWQVQPGLMTVQGTLADAILKVTGERVLPQGSGRTDAGVHALGQVASFAVAVPIPAQKLHHALNRALPPEIRVLRVEAMDERFHARHSALRKSYEYRIFPRAVVDAAGRRLADRICSPLVARFVWDCGWPMRVETMREAGAMVLGEHDFTSFAAVDPDRASRETEDAVARSNVRRIFRSDWTDEDGCFVYRVTGSGFLHHMVRNLVGTFVEIGAGRMPAAAMTEILAARSRSAAGPTAPASGLFLMAVEYAVPA